jgi:subtilase family serine protease
VPARNGAISGETVMSRVLLAAAAVLLLLSGMSTGTAAAAAAATTPAGPATPAGSRTAAQMRGAGARPAGCAARTGPRIAHCYLAAQRAPGWAAARTAMRPGATCTVSEQAGYSPCNLRSAYKLTSLVSTHGKGQTVAVVDAYDDPNAESDLATYRSNFGLPPCTTANGCFTKVNQDGVQGNYPAGDMGWGQEISLDLDMVSAICPKCHILLVEANSNGFGDLFTAEQEAITLGAHVVSNSWGTGEFSGETGYDSTLDTPGEAITFSSGDGAYQGGVQYPSASPYVTSVGGTMLTPASSSRGWAEQTWVTAGSPPTQGSGSGCSAYEAKPAWQTDTGCADRTTADVSAVAANVLGYDSYESGGGGWYYFYGTSVSSPITAGVYALAGNAAAQTAAPASLAYANTSHLFDITKGLATGTCTPSYLCKARKGYDGPTGLGTPKGIGAY